MKLRPTFRVERVTTTAVSDTVQFSLVRDDERTDEVNPAVFTKKTALELYINNPEERGVFREGQLFTCELTPVEESERDFVSRRENAREAREAPKPIATLGRGDRSSAEDGSFESLPPSPFPGSGVEAQNPSPPAPAVPHGQSGSDAPGEKGPNPPRSTVP